MWERTQLNKKLLDLNFFIKQAVSDYTDYRMNCTHMEV